MTDTCYEEYLDAHRPATYSYAGAGTRYLLRYGCDRDIAECCLDEVKHIVRSSMK
jgi:hypothetical protein